MGGRLLITGLATADGGATPFVWNNTTNQGLTLQSSEGVDVDLATGIFTIQDGYAGQWFFTWDFSLTGSNATVQTHQIVGDPAGAATVLFSVDRKLGTGSDVGAASMSGLITVAVGDTFECRMTGDANGRYVIAAMTAFQTGADQ